MMVVVVDVDLVPFPFPIAAAVEVIRGHYPVGIVVQDDAARAVIDSASDEDAAHVLVAAEGISAARTDALVVIVPIAMVLADLVLLPPFVLAVVVALVVAVLVPSFMLAIVVMVVTAVIAMLIAVLERNSQGQSASQKRQPRAPKNHPAQLAFVPQIADELQAKLWH